MLYFANIFQHISDYSFNEIICFVSGDLGCSINAIRFLDSVCSGQQSCEFQVPLPELYNLRCTESISSLYLETSHQCIEGNTFSHGKSIVCFQQDLNGKGPCLKSSTNL